MPSKTYFASWQIRHLVACALVELLQQKCSFQVPKSWGSHWVSWHMWHSEQPQTCTKVQGWDKSETKRIFHLDPFSRYINWSELTDPSRLCHRSRPECGTFGSSSHAELKSNSVSSPHRSLCRITLQMMSSWCGMAFRNNFNISITGLALPMHTSGFSFAVIGTRHRFWNLLFHWRKKLPPPFCLERQWRETLCVITDFILDNLAAVPCF